MQATLPLPLVGNFDVETLKPYLEHYLGGLPSTNSKETYKNLNIQPPTGEITKIVNKGVAEKSSVQLVFSGDYEYNDANNIQMDALEEVLEH
jgi:zinc protease